MPGKIYTNLKLSLTGPVIFWISTGFASFFNWLFLIYAGRSLSMDDFAVLNVFLALQYLLNVPAGALTTTVTRFSAYYSERGEHSKHFYFFRQYWWLTWSFSLLLLLFFGFANPFFQSFFGIKESVYFLAFSVLIVPLFLVSFEKGIMAGQLAFSWVGLLYITESIFKIILIYLLKDVPVSPLTRFILIIPLSVSFTWIISLVIGRSFHPIDSRSTKTNNLALKDSLKFLSNSAFASLGIVLIYNLDILLVKHFMSESDAGIYSTLSVLGKILFFGAGSLIALVIPLSARAQAKGESAKKSFNIIFGLIAFLGTTIYLSYIFIPSFVINILLNQDGTNVIPYISKYSLAMFFLVLITCISTYRLAGKNYIPSRLIVIAAMIQTIGIYFFHSNLGQIVNVVFYTMLGLIIVLGFFEIFKITINTFVLNIFNTFDLLNPFRKIKQNTNSDKLRILIFNWRDTKHIDAGGAEIYIHNIAKKLAKKNYEITVFASNDGNSENLEVLDDVTIVRRGGFFTIYIWAILYYIFKFRSKFDLIIDSENVIPFFTPLFVRKPIILLVFHIHQDVIFQTLVPPISWIANFLESIIMPKIYQNTKIITISKSTAEQLENELGLSVTKIIPSGIDINNYNSILKSNNPLICYLGRIKKYKSIEILILAFQKLIKDFPTAKLIIAGEGDHLGRLQSLVTRLELEQCIQFTGKVTEEDKKYYLGKSWIMVQPSSMEGWGITCLEANACFTPVIASRVSGLKDSVIEGVTGYLFEYGNYFELHQKIVSLINDANKLTELGIGAREWSEQFSWEKQAEEFDYIIKILLEDYLKRKKIITIVNASESNLSFNQYNSDIDKEII